MTRSHLVVGAGEIGRLLVAQLVARGDTVSVATRSGTELEGAQALVLDASDAAAFSAAARGAATIFLCSNPPYHRWVTEWPPIFSAAIAAAAASGARLVIMDNLYPYGQAAMPMTEHSPMITTETKGLVRKAGWEQALAAQSRGEIEAVSVRASDYFGPGAGVTSHIGSGFFTPLRKNGTARTVGNPALLHSWSYLPDIARTLVAASDYEGDWGRVWHVPSGEPRTRVDIAQQANEFYGSYGKARAYPGWVLSALALVSPFLREVKASSYQFTAPFVMDAAETERELGVTATPWTEAFTATAESYR